jgi:hypothetical protein
MRFLGQSGCTFPGPRTLTLRCSLEQFDPHVLWGEDETDADAGPRRVRLDGKTLRRAGA